jgi:hypothetical protein
MCHRSLTPAQASAWAEADRAAFQPPYRADQATPFSKGVPKAKPKKPGRKKGHRAAHRAVPDHVDRVAEASLPATCPDGAGPVLDDDVQVARSTVARAEARLAHRLTPTYQQLLLRLRASAVVHADETGRKVAGQRAWLWVFTNDDLSVYSIDPTRAHAVVERILGEDFAGGVGLRLLSGLRCVADLYPKQMRRAPVAALRGDQ